MEAMITKDWIEDMGRRLARTAAHPTIVSQLHHVRSADVSSRFEEARRVATVPNLDAAGVPMDEDFRITTRSFEEPRIAKLSAHINENAAPEIYFEDHHGFVECDGEVTLIDEIEEGVDDDQSSPVDYGVIESEIGQGIAQIAAFVATPKFQDVLLDLYRTPIAERREFVLHRILNPEFLSSRGVVAPSDMKVQRSHFDDGRPTLFCITKYLTLARPWHKVTVTFDNPSTE